ncbi:MAG: hypothetical protein AB1428_07535 [Bacteroidota bacterium]
MTERISGSYIRLVLGVGRHDADYVDAYYGPPHLKEEAERANLSLAQIRASAVSTLEELASIAPSPTGELERLRHAYLLRQLESLVARTEILEGKKLTFDEESRALYDAVAPTHSESYFQALVKELDGLLPGTGQVPERFDSYRKNFVLPKEKLDVVFTTAVAESRKRTLERISLPPDESFVIEYVTGKSWSGYNWFKGNCHSLIQINTELPITIDRAVDLASHEGYPGHHVYNSLLETNLVRERGWWEFSVYALFSPQSLIAEGTANYGIPMAFPGEERVEFEQEVLFPLASLDGREAEHYYRVFDAFQKLAYAGNEAARRYLNGDISREAAVDWLIRYALMSPERAAQRTRFFDQYRSYVINYNLGQDMVGRYIQSRVGTAANPEKRWKIFGELLERPMIPSLLERD